MKKHIESSLDAAAAKIGDLGMGMLLLACGLMALLMPTIPTMRELQATMTAVGLFLGGGIALAELHTRIAGTTRKANSGAD